MEHSSASRKVFIGGNWKCNGDSKFIPTFSSFLNKIEFEEAKCQVAICPSFIHLQEVKSSLDKKYLISAQNVSMFDNGAFTGEISAAMLKDLGVNWTLVGHSERRQFFNEDEAVLGKKLAGALRNGVSVIYCVGEKLDEREAEKTMEIVKSQLDTLTKNVSDWSKVVVAYEPVWAIGTGKTASPQQAQDVHAEIRSYLSASVNQETAQNVRIIYGGSVTDVNADKLIVENDIDGFLVGGASLKPIFETIIKSYVHKFK